MHVDAPTAYSNADAVRDLYMKVAAEDQELHEHDICGKLAKAMYSTHDATQSRQRKCSETFQELVLTTGKVSPRHFYHQARDVCGLVHRDNFVLMRPLEEHRHQHDPQTQGQSQGGGIQTIGNPSSPVLGNTVWTEGIGRKGSRRDAATTAATKPMAEKT